jgi:SAM-dependent methyltransferase
LTSSHSRPGRAYITALRLYQVCSNLLADPIVVYRRFQESPSYLANLFRYARAHRGHGDGFNVRFRYLYPVLGDRHATAGQASGHYFHQDVWAGRHIQRCAPKRHVDVGSSVAGFVAHLLCFRELEYVDLRPLRTNVSGLHFRQGDLLSGLPYEDGSLESLSCLHVVEHIGLGRYGDPVDPSGWRKAIRELVRVLAPGGVLYFSTPIGQERLEFDAHRVFTPTSILDAFAGLELAEFSIVDDRGNLVPDADPARFDGWYCAGLFRFVKPPQAEGLAGASLLDSSLLDPKDNAGFGAGATDARHSLTGPVTAP